MNRRIVILKTGSTFETLARQEGDFEDWIRAGLRLPAGSVLVADVRSSQPLPDPGATAAVVITGSHDMVTEPPPWVPFAKSWLRSVLERDVPVLGICFGHQLLGELLGGEVGWHPDGREIGTVDVTTFPAAREDPLLSGLPEVFPAQVSHAQSVRKLPPGAVVLAHTEVEPCHAFRVKGNVWGVQFHPEFSETVMRAYLEWYRSQLARDGTDADRLLESVRPSPASEVLIRFAAQVGLNRRRARNEKSPS